MKDDVRAPAPEFSRKIIADTISSSGNDYTLEAGEGERAALARRFDLVSIGSLTASVRLRRVRGEFIRATGVLKADVVQTCVVTLEPVPAQVREEFETLYAPPHLMPKEADEEEEDDAAYASAADAEVMEAIEGGTVDIGELVAQNLSLALDPYPRKPGASFAEIDDPYENGGGGGSGDAGSEAARPNPFAKLASLKRPS